MLLALDVGNTNVTVGVFEDERLVDQRRLRTVRDQTSDEWGILLRNLFALAKLDIARIRGIIVASVVPPLNQSLAEMGERYFGVKPMFVTHTTDTGLVIRYDHPQEVGADRLVNGVAAFHKYGGPCVVVDLGTAITFDAISRDRAYLGRRHRGGNRDLTGGAVRENGAAPVCGVRDSGAGDWDEHSGEYAIGLVLRRVGGDRRDCGALEGGTRAGYEDSGDGRAGAADREGIALLERGA